VLRLPADVGTGDAALGADPVLLADWIEASILMHAPEVTGAQILDVLREGQFLDGDSDDAGWALISNLWSEVRRRRRSHNLAGITVARAPGQFRLTCADGWRTSPAHTFALWCSLRSHYADVPPPLSRDYSRQGDFWEQIIAAGLQPNWPGWEVLRVGWSPGNAQRLLEVATAVAGAIGDRRHDENVISTWTSKQAKDAGLDMVLHRRFPDGLAGPRYFGQAASGANWVNKTQTPKLELWDKVIDWTIRPSLMMMIPFVIPQADFARETWSTQGLLLDRHRVLPDLPESSWVPPPLASELVNWLEPRVAWLLEDAISESV
jgi:hypothetical protein